MKIYKPRLIDSIIEQKLSSIGGIVLRGPRFAGKTTTALSHANSSVRLDSSPQIVQQAMLAPDSLLMGATPRVIDEWQLAPDLWNAVRHEIDQRAKPGQFILAGSAAPNDDVTRHTGTGRLARVALKPMTLQESKDSLMQVNIAEFLSDSLNIGAFGGLSVKEYAELIVRGGWPALVERSPEEAQDALSDYVSNVAAVDLRTLDSPPDPIRMEALIRAIARNLSTEASLEKLAKESQISGADLTTKTVRKYLDQLAQIYILDELPAWKIHLRSSIQMRVKSKWHFVDPSLAAAALAISVNDLIADPETLGLFFESLARRDLSVYAQCMGASLFHYRDSSELEIDFILQGKRGDWAAIEVKLGGAAGIDEAVENFKKLKRRIPDSKLELLRARVIITAGQSSYIRPDGVAIVALGHLGLWTTN